jgi:hypothetical protein
MRRPLERFQQPSEILTDSERRESGTVLYSKMPNYEQE